MSCLIGVDLGTSACKTIVFSLEGEKVSETQREYPTYHPQPRWAEQKPSEWWKATVITIKESLKKARMGGHEIVGLAVDSQREAVVPIGKRGKELHNSIIWLDNRTKPQVEEIKKKIDEETVLYNTGVRIEPIYSASKILWLKDNVPKVFTKTKFFLCAKDYVTYKLTGEFTTDYSMASRTMLFDINKKIWSENICTALGVELEKLPPAKESSKVIGEVTFEASKKTHLPKGLQVVNGGGDRPCECLGAGVTLPGHINIGTGTGSVVEIPLHEPAIDVKGRVNCCCHVIPDMWEYELIIATTGASLRWFRDTFGHKEKDIAWKTNKDPYDLITEKASNINPGSDSLFFYPYLTGAFSPKFNEKARGVFFGINLSHNKGHFARAILEGVAFQYLETFGLIRALNIDVEKVTMVGGETKSRLWNQIKADILGRSIYIPRVGDAAALGAALLAGVGTGHYSSVLESAEEAVKIASVYTSDPEKHDIYSKIYNNFRKVYSFIEKAFEVH